MSEDLPRPSVLIHSPPSFIALPDDIFFRIFSLLPLRSVLQLERLCQRLHHAISSYLATVKCIELYFPTTAKDIFRVHDRRVVDHPISPNDLSRIIARCPQATAISYIPVLGTSKPYREKLDELVYVLTQHRKIKQISFCDSFNVLSAVRKLQPYLDVRFNEICVDSTDLDYAPQFLSSVCVNDRERLSLGRNTLDYADFDLLAKFTEIEILECSLTSTSHFGKTSSTFSHTDFPNLKSFTYSEITRYSYSPAFASLMSAVTQSPVLITLKLVITNFNVLVDTAHNWRSEILRNLELTSAGSYSASLEHISLAPVVADLITMCASSLETLILASSVLVKQFFTNLVSKLRCFAKLKTFSMTGIADTKMFLAPGNMVETRYYQDFISICPNIISVSLHSFSGSLTSLCLPLGLKEIILPWDNRLNLTQHRDAVFTTLSSLPNLEKLTISGVEEVDSLLQESSALQLRGPPVLAIESETLLKVRLSNICIRKLDLRGCTRLRSFVLHYCPVLQTLLLPARSLQQVHIYDSYHPYMPKFLENFLLQKDRSASCHLRVQIHSMRRKEPEMASQPPNDTRYKEFTADVASACSAASNLLDFAFLCDEKVKLFQHNSGEPLFPFTEFQTCIPSCARSAEDIRCELNRRKCVLEGIQRWQNCLQAVTQESSGDFVSTAACSTDCSGEREAMNVLYCNSNFRLQTNIPYFLDINQSSLCQSSGYCGHDQPGDSERLLLNVPRLAEGRSNVLKQYTTTNKPTVIISTSAYAHDIHTLFYYA